MSTQTLEPPVDVETCWGPTDETVAARTVSQLDMSGDPGLRVKIESCRVHGDSEHEHAAAMPFPADSLAMGIAALIVLTLSQKFAGLIRGTLFCSWLDETALGQWSMAQNFLALAAPLLVLGVPGTFGRYLAYYQQRRRGREFLTVALLGSLALATVGMTALLAGRAVVSEFVFGGDVDSGLLTACLAAVAVVLAMNVAFEILTAGRQNRFASLIHTVQSLLFAVGGVGLLYVGPRNATTVAIAFLLSCLVAGLVGWVGVVRLWKHLSRAVESESIRPTHRDRLSWSVWRHVIPLAASVWAMNLLANLFEAADRYVLLHCAGLTAADALGQIGQYHASLLLPLLLSGGGASLAALALPHLSHAWEADDRPKVAVMQNGLLRLTAIGSTVAGLIALVGAPWLFGVIWGGRFAHGEAVLPIALAYGSILALVFLAQNDLWVRERGRWGVVAMAVGLAINVVMGVLLAPTFGLAGVVWATLVSTVVSLALMLGLARLSGADVPWRTIAVCGLPLVVLAGPVAGSILLGVIVAAGVGTGTLIERHELAGLIRFVRRRFGAIKTR